MVLTEEQQENVLLAARFDDVHLLNDVLRESGGTYKDVFACRNEQKNTPLHFCAANGHIDFVRHLLPHATLRELLSQNDCDNTPLHWAAYNGREEVVEALLDAIEEGERADKALAQELRAAHDAQEENRFVNYAYDDLPYVKQDEAIARHIEQLRDRPLWDMRNEAGYGPMTEAEMNGKEHVVQLLLRRLAQGDDELVPGGDASAEPDTDGTAAGDSRPEVS